MTKSHTPVLQTTVPKCKKGFCCTGKKLVTYSCKVWCMVGVCLVLIAAAAVLMYFLLSKSGGVRPEKILSLPKKSDWFPECPSELSEPEERFDCYPDDSSVTRSSCEARGCCYLEKSNLVEEVEGNLTTSLKKMPRCVYPKNYGYVSDGKTTPILNGFVLPLQRVPAPSRYGDDIQVVHMKVEMQTKYRLRIKFYDPENYRFEVPVPKIQTHSSIGDGQNGREVYLYSVAYNVHSKVSSIKVRRSSSDAVIFDTSIGALLFANQFLELTTKLASFKIYGFGQHGKKHQKNAFNLEPITMFSSKAKDRTSSSIHPMYLCSENDGNAYGVLLLNSNALEVQFHPLPAVTFRAIGGVLDFYLFLGPSPEEVIQQYTEAVGRPSIPPYWSLGLHVGQLPHQSLDETEKLLNELKTKHIPWESLILNDDIALKMPSKNKEKLSNLTSSLKNRNQKLILQLTAGIPKDVVLNRDSAFNSALVKDVFICDKWGWNPIEGKYYGKTVVYPDFGNSESVKWWSKAIKKVSSTVDFDGLWLTNNEPTSKADGSISGCLSDNLNSPPYVPVLKQKMSIDICFDS